MNSRAPIIALITACALGAGASTARSAPNETEDRLTLPRMRVTLDVFLEANLSRGAAYEPFSIAPDLWFGATDALTLGLVHSTAGRTGFIDGFGDALCLTGAANGCPQAYNNVGVDLRYALARGSFAWALDGGLFFQKFSPVQLAIKLGALGRFRSGRFALELEPAVFVGLTNRTETITVMGVTTTQTTNGDVLSLPITGLVWVSRRVALALQVGVRVPIEDASNTYAISLSLGAHVVATDKLALTAAFSLTRVVGGGNADALDGRALVIGGAYAF
jgi:hypothetical protein